MNRFFKLFLVALIGSMSLMLTNCGPKSAADYADIPTDELIKMSDNGDIEATLQLGRQAIHDMDKETAKKYFQKAADENDPRGLHNLALINVTDQQMDECVANLEKAIAGGFEPSKGWLACVLIMNPNKTRMDEGFKLAQEASQQNDKAGYMALAYYYLQQNGQLTKGDQADINFDKAIEAGSSSALYMKVPQMLQSGYSNEEVISFLEKNKSVNPKVTSDLIKTINGDWDAIKTPYYNDGYQGIEDMML